MNPSYTADVNFMRVDEIVVESVTIVVKRLLHFFLINNTFLSTFPALVSWGA